MYDESVSSESYSSITSRGQRTEVRAGRDIAPLLLNIGELVRPNDPGKRPPRGSITVCIFKSEKRRDDTVVAE